MGIATLRSKQFLTVIITSHNRSTYSCNLLTGFSIFFYKNNTLSVFCLYHCDGKDKLDCKQFQVWHKNKLPQKQNPRLLYADCLFVLLRMCKLKINYQKAKNSSDKLRLIYYQNRCDHCEYYLYFH